MAMKNKVRSDEQVNLIGTLRMRFHAHLQRHPGVEWAAVLVRFDTNPDALRSLEEMERTGGEPDVVRMDVATGEAIFFDCVAESPKGRRSLAYDRAGLESRKDFPPESSAVDVANEMGISLLTEEEYHFLQTLGVFDTKTSSWLATPPSVRELGGAIFGDARYGRVFIYHNGAQSYYASRGFRGSFRV